MLTLPIAKRAAIHARVIVVSRRNAVASGLGNPFHAGQFLFGFGARLQNSPSTLNGWAVQLNSLCALCIPVAFRFGQPLVLQQYRRYG
jgi:hypothetical protein